MSLAGPRLDRPSAIGDEGRPRAASLWIATLVVLALTVGAGVAVGEPSLVTLLATVVGLTVAGFALTDRTGFVELFVGYGLIVSFGPAFALIVLFAPVVGPAGIAVSGLTISLFGIAMAWADVGGDETIQAVGGCALTYGSFLFSSALVAICAGLVVFGSVVLLGVIETSTAAGSLAGFAFVAIVTSLCLVVALWALPIRQFTARSRRDRVERRLERARKGLVFAIMAAFGLGAVAVVLLVVPAVEGTGGTNFLETIFLGLTSPVVVLPFVAIGLASIAASVLTVGLRLLTRRFETDTSRWIAAIAVGVAIVALGTTAAILAAVAIAVVNPTVAVSLTSLGLMAFVFFAVGPPVFLLVGFAVFVAVVAGVVPDRAGGPALAAVGLVLAAVGLAWVHPIPVFACLAGAAVVWDVSTYGLGLTAELGHLPDSRRLELFHGVLSVAVAIGAVLVAVALELVRTSVFGGFGGTGALLAIGIGAVILLFPLRG
ncbi:DUF7519 family protein [Natrarchaeobius chitinivorans]|uniref:Uncharacterized protein n=1 Tax=Natrarchaeobius chitinivorans TaxID=1679083 RepID=A0A3N6P380_NATCH|nr:hypothetical protein [Natrarchaeobius chitinivorans]RQG92119.1 hypothetical protein EA473_17855 [Natrarchaeobius chitinivorans]